MGDFSRGLDNLRRRSMRLLLGTAGVVGLTLFVSAATIPTGETLPVGSKTTPKTLTVYSSSSLPPEVQAQEAATAPYLFDRDTNTLHVAYAESQVEAEFESVQEVRTVKVYGAAPYLLTIKAESAGAYQTISGLENLNLTQLPNGWTAFDATTPVSTGKLMFVLTPATGGSATGLREIEAWTTTAPASIKNGTALLEKLLGPSPPPQGRAYTALNPTSNPTVGVITPSGDDTSDNTFSFTLDRNPAHFVRAYLTYELNGQSHWISVRRDINGLMSNAGGGLILPATTWSTQVERINPAWLKQGTNTIGFTVLSSSYQNAGYTVRNVRVIAELDTGANMIETITLNQPDATGTNPVDVLIDGDTATGWKPYPADQPISASSPSVEFEFRRPTQMDAVSFYLSAPIEGELQVSVKQAGQWTDYPPEQGSVLATGWNTIYVPAATPLDQRVLEAVKLTFRGGYQSIAEIREFLFVGSAVGGRAVPPKIRVTYPDVGQFYGRSAYFQGFVDPWDNGSGLATITVGGQSQIHFGGNLSTVISKDTVGLTTQADSDPWSAEVKAVYPNGETVSTIVQLTQQMSPAAPAEGALAGSVSATVSKKGKKTITNDESKLVFDSGSVAADTTITITPLADENVPALDVGMTNVTKGPRRGYRFLPHGAKFLKNVAVTLPYDKALIPPGHTEDDIKTFYFDDNAGRWVALPYVSVDKSGKLINSTTDHFTDMINAVVTVPDHPQTVSFNPTSMKDIKAADPGSQVNLIEPPRANNLGDARLSYPIEVPPGRAGLQPQLAVQYNSAGGNGWMGMGWDIPMQAISIDTRWGVPRYDAALETETYVFNGEQLTPVAHRGELQPRAAEKVFHTRVEGQFRKIVRHGNSPSTYWWEVTDKNGTKFIYGGDPVTNLPTTNSTLTDDTGNVFLWSLREIQDTNGNFIKYHCVRVSDTGVAGGTVPGVNLYLQRITYTGTGATEGPYTVTFVRDRELNESLRIDKQIDARGGFKRVTADLLRKVEVTLSGQPIRSYEFKYNENPYGDNRPGTAFNKTLLTLISQFGDDQQLFNMHTFRYFDEARDAGGSYHGFVGTVDWTVGNDSISAGLFGKGLASALGGNRSTSTGAHLYVGVGPIIKSKHTPTKKESGGLKIGYSRSRGETLITLADMNGDGLPDKVFKSGDSFFYRPNLSGPAGTTSFGESVPLPSLPAISRESVTSTTVGAEIYFGLPVMIDRNRAVTQADAYFSDVNGDGITDLVSGGQAVFGYVNAAGVPTFSANSSDTPVPIGAGAVITDDLLEDASAIEAERAANFPLLDTLRRWVAPYDGVISINAPVRLIEDTSTARAEYGDKADGVRVAIQLEGAELWATTIGGTNYDPHVPTGVNALPVHRGDRLYFRVQSGFDGAYDQVAWDPEITYTGVDTARTDVNNLAEYRYRASGDFTLAGRRVSVTAPLTGTLHLAGSFEKTGVTTDDVTLFITHNGAEVYRRTFGFAETATVNLSQDVAVTQLDDLEWHVLVDSPIDVARIRFTPSAYYTAAQDVDSVQDEQGNYVIQVNPPYDVDLYPANGLTAPQAPWTVPTTGTVTIQPALSFDFGDSTPTARVVFTVKKRGVLLAKREVQIVNGVVPDPVTPAFNLAVSQGDELFFDFSTLDTSLAASLTSQSAAVSYDGVNYTTVPSVFHSAVPEGLFPQPYRGWGAVGYNGNSPRDAQPIDQSLLVLDDSYDANNARVYPFVPNPAAVLWGGPDELAWVKAGEASSSRLGLDDIRMPRSEQFAGASAVSRISRSTNNSASALGVSASDGDSESQLEFQDLNGDRFPDVIGHGGVQYSNMVGGLGSKRGGAGLGSARNSDNETVGVSTDAAGNVAVAIAMARGNVAGDGQKPGLGSLHGGDMPPIGFSANIGTGKADTKHDLIDINGDGLPDKVYDDGTAALNLGYSFAAAEPWGGGIVNQGRSLDAGGGANLGFNKDFYSFAAGLSLSIGETKSEETYADVNGDGLPDKIVAGSPYTVRLNTGSGFTDSITWPGGGSKVAVDKRVSLGGGVYFTFEIPVLLIRIVINPGINLSTNMGRPEIAFRDVDGDGYADHVTTQKDSELKVAANPIGRTNLLKKVHRPLGATFEMEYTRDGNTFDLPQSRWVMTKVTTFDGHVGEGADTQLMTYGYTAPKYNRLERDFYGYTSVTENHLDTQNANALYRTISREYFTDSYYTKGLMTREVLQNESGAPFTETENTYLLRNVDTGLEPADAASTSATIFPMLTRTDRRFYEGQVSPGKSTYTTHEYDTLGNVTRFVDTGDVGATDDVEAIITYTNCASYVIQPDKITVKGNGVEMRRRESTIDCATGNVSEVRQFLANGQVAVTNLTYFANGNLQTVTGPANQNNQRYVLTYEYDPVVATHVTRISDSFGLSSQATHNYKFGKVETTTDTNNNQTTYFYDAFGRVDKIVGPYEQGPGQSVATLDFDYAPVQTPTSGTDGVTAPLTAVPWALTQHVDKDAAGAYKSSGTIDTILFTDGLKRVLQTKKDATVLDDGSSGAVDKMIVSGQVTFDAFSRTVTQKYPVTEPKGTNTTHNSVADTVAATTMIYDVLDRNVRTTIPDGSFTTIAYGFGADRGGQTQFETHVTDANVNASLPGAIKFTYRDVRELITAVKEKTAGPDLWTSYAYDALKQITQVVDDQNNTTSVAYDNLGRRTSINNPDTGQTDTVYDLASNVTAKITANLRAQSQQISYDYDFTRLVAVRYPTFTGNNITYTYGAAGSPNNTAGRITQITSQMGTEERQYGQLGEVTYEKKTVVTFTTPNSPEVFETRFLYDTFGRLLTLTYPDGEFLTYVYDSGGNLKSAEGVKGTPSSGGLYRYGYLKGLSYDKFEQRVLLDAGNSVKTAYTYNAQTRRLANLTAGKGTGNLFQNLNYTYDLVGNILGLQNDVPVPPPSQYGGPTAQTFAYDNLYRLTHAEGTYQYAPSKTHTYNLDLGYDSIHNITTKNQLHTIVQPSQQAITQKKTTYNWAYAYNPSGANSTRPHAPLQIGERASPTAPIVGRSYTYDANGNQLGWTHDQNGTNRTIVWDEDNRIQTLADQGHVKYYKYDDQGQRIIKRGPQGETVYVNQFYTQRPGATGTKHVYAGTTRLVSKLVKQDTPNGNPQGATPYEKDLYFYHPDHLGSSNYITDTQGKLYEHLEYFPFGEGWVEENSNTQRTPYLFTAKELDEETGLYYYGARYFDPRTSVWQSGDPILARYLPNAPKKSEEIVRLLPPTVQNPSARIDLPGMGGVYASSNLGLYGYGHLNPLKYRDPDGNVVEVSEEMRPVVEKLSAGSPTAARTLDFLQKDPRKFYIQKGNDPSGGSAQPVRAAQPTMLERLFLGKERQPDSFLITVSPENISSEGIFDMKGNQFLQSTERVLGHELGHALIWATEGDVGFILNQQGAVNLENTIARELDPKAPIRHPTRGHERERRYQNY